jgi:gamma-glutamyltranspeptidase/glutathione hydrolase
VSVDDFGRYEPEWVTPLDTTYRGHQVQVMPPNSYGLLMLMQLNALGGIAPGTLMADDATRLGYLIRAQRAAFARGQRFIADPATDPAPLELLLGEDTTAALREAVRAAPGSPAPHPSGGTSCISMADAHGNACCVVQSVFHPFGSAFLDPASGVLLNNRMQGFTLESGHPGVLAPGKRPAHTLNPVLVSGERGIEWVMATPGGPGQTLTLIQLLTHLLDGGLDLASAIEQPRWSVDLQGQSLLDTAFAHTVAENLARKGIETARAEGAAYFGSAKVVQVLPDGVLVGACDTRREAFALGG